MERPIKLTKIYDCHRAKQTLSNVANMVDSIATALITQDRPLVEEYLRSLPAMEATARAELTDEADRRLLDSMTDYLVRAGYEGLRQKLEVEGTVPTGSTIELIYLDELVRCACPCR